MNTMLVNTIQSANYLNKQTFIEKKIYNESHDLLQCHTPRSADNTIQRQHIPYTSQLGFDQQITLTAFDLKTCWNNYWKQFAIVQIDVIRIQCHQSKISHLESISSLVHPKCTIDYMSTKIHKIQNKDVKNSHPWSHWMYRAKYWLENDVLVGFDISHNDIPLLCREQARYGQNIPLNVRILDIRRVWIALHGYKGRLIDVATNYGISLHEQYPYYTDNTTLCILILEKMIEQHGHEFIQSWIQTIPVKNPQIHLKEYINLKQAIPVQQVLEF